MRSTLFLVILLGSVQTVSAQNLPTEETERLCIMRGILAKYVMENRQAGTPPAEILAKATDEMKSTLTALVQMAYIQPQHTDEGTVRREVEDFRLWIEETCWRNRHP